MKKLFIVLTCILITSFDLKAQTAKWFIGFSTGLSIGGPGPSIKNNLTDQHFTLYSEGFLTSHYFPTTYHNPCVLFIAGTQVSKYGSLYLQFGRPTGGLIDAYRTPTGTDISYYVLQFTLGYQFTFPNSRLKLGVGPSIFIVKVYPGLGTEATTESPETKPGVSVMTRVPLGTEKKPFGLELFFEMNVAGSADMSKMTVNNPYGNYTLEASSISMVFAVLGVSFVFRK